MTRSIEASVLIVGGGPVGLTLAMDLASRGVDVIVTEIRHAGELPSVKCNQVSSRSMEVYRRLGIAKTIRSAGLPQDHPHDVACRISATGRELSRISLPSPEGRARGEEGDDSWWPTPEATHRINQTFLEPILFRAALEQPRIRILNRTQFEEFSQDERGVVGRARDLDSGERVSISCKYLVGCDGARSVVRRGIGAELSGIAVIQRVQSTYFRAPTLKSLMPGKPAWMVLAFNPRRCGTMMSIDGKDHWLIHNFLYNGEPEFDSIDRDWAIRSILGVGPEFEYEIISKEDWIGRRLVADRFQNGRVFICGDAAHLWIPHAGYGMNAGIADADNLGWMLAAVLNGWAEPALLAAYQAERQPITEQVSRFAFKMSQDNSKQRREISEEIEQDGPAGDTVRAAIGKQARDLYIQQQCCGGLNFGYFYESSPVIAYDGAPHPEYSMGQFTSAAVPGWRAPHFWLPGRRSLYDALGQGFGLLRFDRSIAVDGLAASAAKRGLPLTVLDVADAEATALYAGKLVLVRPDRHVAWRGNAAPDDPLKLIDHLRGASQTSRQPVYSMM